MEKRNVDFTGENVLVTGITGFVGPYLAEFLLTHGANVYGLLRRRSDGKMPKNITESGIEDKINLVIGDLTDISSLANAVDKSKPDYVFHLAAQSYVPASFRNPLETVHANALGTVNLLEVIKLSNYNPSIVFAGSSEEYGLVITSEDQFKRVLEKRHHVFPKPDDIPEVPVKETNPLRPMSPYGVTKVFGDHIMRNYFHSYGLRTKVSRAFNHEGARRGEEFVTSTIAKQVMRLKHGEQDKIEIGNVNAFRDWSHVKDIVKGYCIIAKRGQNGDVYNQGSMRVNSVLSYILLALETAGYDIKFIETLRNNKRVDYPTSITKSIMFGVRFPKTKIDEMMLKNEVIFKKEDKGLKVHTQADDIIIIFDKERFRPAEVPVLLSDTSKIQKLGFKSSHSLTDIINDQLNYYLDPDRR